MSKPIIQRVCVFCGSSRGRRREYEESARDLARALAEQRIDLVYGGGSVGLMGILADEMLRLQRQVIGVIPRALAAREVANLALADLRVVGTMHERKSLMAELSDAFIALPGGFGTFEELFEIITWAQLGIHQKPIGLLNVNGYFDPLLLMISRAVEDEFIRPQYNQLIVIANEIPELLDLLSRFEPMEGLTKWVDLVET
jgi:uncharacterized protein (TIGR00730 family)